MERHEDARTLVRLLDDFCDDLRRCLDNETEVFIDSVNSLVSIPDPILLGNFIVDAYNEYLAEAKARRPDGIVQRLQPIEPLSEDEQDAALAMSLEGTVARLSNADAEPSGRATHGGHPRIQKMNEVLVAARLLANALREPASDEEEERQEKLEGLIELLDDLGSRIREGLFEMSDEAMATVPVLVETYNRYLALAREIRTSASLRQLFVPIEPVSEVGPGEEVSARAEYRRKLAEVEVAQSGLERYLRNLFAREQQR